MCKSCLKACITVKSASAWQPSSIADMHSPFCRQPNVHSCDGSTLPAHAGRGFGWRAACWQCHCWQCPTQSEVSLILPQTTSFATYANWKHSSRSAGHTRNAGGVGNGSLEGMEDLQGMPVKQGHGCWQASAYGMTPVITTAVCSKAHRRQRCSPTNRLGTTARLKM
jgi:hypothetical protein